MIRTKNFQLYITEFELPYSIRCRGIIALSSIQTAQVEVLVKMNE